MRHPIEEHIPRLRRYAVALLRDRALADDLVQDTLERALKKFSLFQPGTDLRAWLFTMMHNIHVNQVRQDKTSQTTTITEVEISVADSTANDAINSRDLLWALERIPPEQRTVLLLVGLEQLPYDSVAGILGIPIGTVMSRLSRARELLRKLMSGETTSQLRRVK